MYVPVFRAPRRRLLAGALTLLAVVAAAWAEPAAAPAKPSTQAKYLKLASAGVARSAAWWDGRRHWYRESLSNKDRLATLWG
ncbi:MAG: hypothetical protein QOJ57_1467, partial [Thermoleophilaceae bacterium]|nr:hypothetical protein [Thermoleophilaceae bacterium]